jgi:hypothetical protein
MRQVLACVAALYRMPLFLVQGGAPATRTGELPVRHKYCRRLSDQAAAKQLDLFGLPDAKDSNLEFEWQQLPQEIRETVTRLMVRLLVDHQPGDRQPSSAERRGDV